MFEYQTFELDIYGNFLMITDEKDKETGYYIRKWVSLDSLGVQGWELVSVVNRGPDFYGWFKRGKYGLS